MGWFRKINKNGEDYKPIGNVITATSLSVSGPDLADGDVVRVMFTTDIAGSDTSTPLALTWNSGATPIPVKAMKNGSLVGIYAIEYAANLYRYISAYATLELVYDGTNAQFVVVGNPVVLSGTDYTIYADGQKVCLQVGAQYTSTSATTYSTSWTTANFVFSDVPKGKYQVGWSLFPGLDFSGSMNVNGKISIVLSYAYNGGYYQTTEIIDAYGGQLTYACDISVSDPHGATFSCVLTRIA